MVIRVTGKHLILFLALLILQVTASYFLTIHVTGAGFAGSRIIFPGFAVLVYDRLGWFFLGTYVAASSFVNSLIFGELSRVFGSKVY